MSGEPLFTFEEAIHEPRLLKARFERCSKPQQVVLKAFYGLPLTDEELYYWAIFQEQCEVDALGYPTKVHTDKVTYDPKEYSQLACVFGRRSGKTDAVGGTILAYESALGGHHEFVSASQTPFMYIISHKKENSVENLGFVKDALESSPTLRKQITSSTTESITLKNGVVITGAHPSIRGQRGLAVPVYVADEANFWYVDEASANPDTAVQTALRYAQRQFPRSKRVWLSTPFVKRGVFYGLYEAGTQGCKLRNEDLVARYKNTLVCWGPTAALENPMVTKAKLEEDLAEDPEKYQQESNARFADSISGFLSSNLLREAIDAGVGVRAPLEKGKNDYVMAIDPAFRHDAFACVVVHKQDDKVYVDYAKRWVPEKGVPLNPATILDEVTSIARKYHIDTAYTDQYSNEALRQLALDRGLGLADISWTVASKPKIWANFRNLVNHHNIKLLDPQYNEHASVMFTELVRMERTLTGGGNIQIKAPNGEHDDMAMAVAMATNQAMNLNNYSKDWIVEEYKEPTPFEIVMKQLERRALEQEAEVW